MDALQNLLSEKPYLVWYVKDKKSLSEASILEHILNYGNWDDYLKTEKFFGVKKVRILFEKLKKKKRSNLRPHTVNYFNNYFAKYA